MATGAEYGLVDRLFDVAAPLSEAFEARFRSIHSSHLDTGSLNPAIGASPAQLLANLLRVIQAGDDVEGIVKLSATVAASHGHSPAIVIAYRDAIQALDWAIRDLQLEQYTAVERERFSTSTALFAELVRRATGDANAGAKPAGQQETNK